MVAQELKDSKELPGEIPVFPLPGVLLLPGGQLPLNIFEPRYLSMVEDALKGSRIIGMIQPRPGEKGQGATPPLFEIGCAGKITAFEETDDGRYLITLTGLSRFRIRTELPLRNGYRSVQADWSEFTRDMVSESCLDLDRGALRQLLLDYFRQQGITCEWDAIDCATDHKLITCLAMVCPLEANEKQALLEATCCRQRAQLFMTMLEMAISKSGDCGGCH